MTASTVAFQGVGQKPVNMLGPQAPHSFIGVHHAYFQGATGLVATAAGIPFLTMTRSRTGIYDLRFPRTQSVSFTAQLQAPTGFHAQAEVKNSYGPSGTGEIHIVAYRHVTQASGLPPTGAYQLVNPPTGTQLKVTMMAFPSSPPGLTKF